MSTYVPLERALERFDAAVRPTPRTLREKMLSAGCFDLGQPEGILGLIYDRLPNGAQRRL